MRKMGNFKGLPVFWIIDFYEWNDIEDNYSYDEKIYVYNSRVYYKGSLIADIDGNTLQNFNEDLFNTLRRKNWNYDKAKTLAHVTSSAEMDLQEEERSVSECSDPVTAIDEFMNNWKLNIDNEISILKNTISAMEVELNAIN